jgi:hypothetical protein
MQDAKRCRAQAELCLQSTPSSRDSFSLRFSLRPVVTGRCVCGSCVSPSPGAEALGSTRDGCPYFPERDTTKMTRELNLIH